MQFGGYYRSVSLEQNSHAGLLKYDENNNVSVVNNGTSLANYSVDFNSNATTSTKNASAGHYRITSNTSYENNMPPYLTVYMWIRTA